MSPGADSARQLAGAIAGGQAELWADALTQHIAERVDGCLERLQSRWQVDYATSLRASMDSIGTWRTTADFLALANDKAAAETDIALGSALMVAAGRHDYAPYLLDTLEHDAGAFDIDATIARRILLHVSGVDGGQDDWLTQLRGWLDDQPRGPNA